MTNESNVNRRHFMGASLAAAAALGAPQNVLASLNTSVTPDGKPVKSQVGLILYTLRDFLKTRDEIARTLERVKKIGYGTVEITSTGAISNEELGKILLDNELAAVSCHASWDGLTNDLQRELDNWKQIGCHHLVVSSIPGPYRERKAEGYREFAKTASEIAAKMKEQGMTLGYHNHSFEFEKDGGMVLQDILRTEGDPDLFLFEIDTYWVQHGGGDPAQWIRKVAGRVPTVHMKDMVMDGSNQLFGEVGEGNLNWTEILKACKQAGVEYYIVEQDRCQRDPFESVEMSYKNMTSWGLV